MTHLEIDQALIEITREKCNECKARLDAVSKENVTERKALQLEYGMYTFCGNAGLMFHATGNRTHTIQIRKRFLNNVIAKYPKLHARYTEINEEEKLRLLAALQAELFLRDQWLHSQYAELAAAEASGDVTKAFECTIKIGAVQTMFAAWEAWRRENSVYPDLLEVSNE